MNFREKMADWISGGKLSSFRKERDEAKASVRDTEAELRRSMSINRLYYIALDKILDQDTPSGNATVKRMVRYAKAAINATQSI